MLHIYKDSESLLYALADFVVEQARKSIDRSGRFNFVLSGGNSPKRLYLLLVSDEYRNRIDWKKVFFFFGDERYVPLDHSSSNFLMVKNSLFVPLNVPDSQIFQVNTTLPPDECAIDYEQRILRHFQEVSCRFDLILLGLGDNSHTASLFPHTSVVHEEKALIKEIYVPEVNMYRITFTAPLINAAHAVAFLVYGASKAEAMYNILREPLNVDEYPAQLVRPESGELHWFVDEEAGSRVRSRERE